MTPENVTGPIAHHAEAPVWWAGWGGLRWVDGSAGDLLALRPEGVTRQHIDDEYLAFARPRSGGGLVAVGARTLYLADDVDGDTRAVASLGDDPRVRMNDGCCDPRGRLLAGSMAYDAAADAGIRWDDPAIGVDWPISAPSLSGKDLVAPLLKDVPQDRLPTYEAIAGAA